MLPQRNKQLPEMLGFGSQGSHHIPEQWLREAPGDTEFALSPEHRTTPRRVQDRGPSLGTPSALGRAQPRGKGFGLLHGGSSDLHLKTAEELLLLLLGALAGCCQWETVLSNAPGAKKCELCRLLAPLTGRIAGSDAGARRLRSQPLTEAAFPSLPKFCERWGGWGALET